MNEKEVMILKLISDNPFITQNELAERTGLSRSAVAGYISSFIKEGKLLGRAYVFPERKNILCIGGANVDRKIKSIEDLKLGTSNPAKTTQSIGGVARNIAENIGRLGLDVSLLSVVGEDPEGEWLLNGTKSYVDISPTKIHRNETTGTYTAILDHTGEMTVALADMAIYDSVNEDFIIENWGYIKSADLVILDTNFPKDVLHFIITKCGEENIQICISPVSSPKVRKLPENLKGVSWLILNQDEAEVLSGSSIKSEGDFFKAAEKIIDKGVEKVVITRGDKGLIYFTNTFETGSLLAPKINVIDVTGAGDSLVAGMMYAHLKGLTAEVSCKMGMACSMLTLQSSQTVNPSLSSEKLNEIYKQYFQ